MPLPNQYGVDLGNIMSTASNLKTARLNREMGDYNLEKQKEIDLLEKERKSNEQFAKLAIQVSALPPAQQQQALDQAVSNFPPKAQSFFKQKGYDAQSLPHIINDALTIDQVYDRYIKNPQDQKAKLQLERVRGDKKLELKQMEKEYDRKTKLEIEELKAKIPSKNKKEFEQLMDALDDPNMPEDKRARYKARLDKITQPDMSSLLINANTVKAEQEALAVDLGLSDPYQLATIDMSQLTPEQQAKANQTASIIVKGLGANAKAAEKKMGEYGSLSNQMQNALSHYQDVGEFRVVDEATKKYFSNYFGLSDEELKSTEAAQALQSMLNIKIKADSGSAVTGQEMVRNVLETATPFMTKTKIITGIKNVAERYKGELTSLKNVMGPIAFNLKYGTVLKNYDNIIDAANTAMRTDTNISPSGKTLEQLRGGTQQKQIVRTGMSNGRKVIQYSDGSIEYAR